MMGPLRIFSVAEVAALAIAGAGSLTSVEAFVGSAAEDSYSVGRVC